MSPSLGDAAIGGGGGDGVVAGGDDWHCCPNDSRHFGDRKCLKYGHCCRHRVGRSSMLHSTHSMLKSCWLELNWIVVVRWQTMIPSMQDEMVMNQTSGSLNLVNISHEIVAQMPVMWEVFVRDLDCFPNQCLMLDEHSWVWDDRMTVVVVVVDWAALVD